MKCRICNKCDLTGNFLFSCNMILKLTNLWTDVIQKVKDILEEIVSVIPVMCPQHYGLVIHS